MDHSAFRSLEHDRIFGYTQLLPEWTYEMFLEHVLPEDRAMVDGKFQEATENQSDWSFESRIRRTDGQVRWIWAAGRHTNVAAGAPLRMAGIVQDITERKQVEEALRESERLYRAIGESIDYGVWVCAPDGRNIYASESFLKMVGLTQEECSNFGWGDVLHPDDAAQTIEAWRECVRTEGTWDIEHRFRGVDGQWHAILARGVPVRNDQKEIIRWAGINLDISELKRAEAERERLRIEAENERRRLEAVLEALPVGLAITDPQGGNIRSNRAFEQIWSGPLPRTESIDDYSTYKAWWADTGKPVDPEEWASAQAIRKREPVFHQVMKIQRFDGSLAFVINSAAPVFDDHNKIAGCAVAIQDITDLRKAEEALKESEARFRLLSETAGQLLATNKPSAKVNELCRMVMEHLDCQVFFNFLADEESGRLHLNACAGIPEAEVRKIEWLDYGAAVCGCVARDGVRIVAENIGLTPDPRTDLVRSYNVRAYACHPLMARDRLIGTLSFGSKTRAEFTPGDLALMKTVSDQVSTAMERIGLIGELQRARDDLERRVQERTAELELLNQALKAENELRLESEIELRESENRLRHLSTELLNAQEKERRLVAQDLHDSIGSSLAAIKFKVEAALSQTGNNTLQQEPALKGVIPAIQTAIQETRRIQKALRPPVLDELGILATIRWFCREFESTYTTVRIRQEIEIEEEEVPDSLKTVIFRILQEALNNIAKYSGADLARLSLRKAPGSTELVIEDHGQGFDLKKVLGLESTSGD